MDSLYDEFIDAKDWIDKQLVDQNRSVDKSGWTFLKSCELISTVWKCWNVFVERIFSSSSCWTDTSNQYNVGLIWAEL